VTLIFNKKILEVKKAREIFHFPTLMEDPKFLE